MINNFVYIKNLNTFTSLLKLGKVSDEAIAFIEDTKEIWTHNQFFGNQKWSVLKNVTVQDGVLNILADVFETSLQISNGKIENNTLIL